MPRCVATVFSILMKAGGGALKDAAIGSVAVLREVDGLLVRDEWSLRTFGTCEGDIMRLQLPWVRRIGSDWLRNHQPILTRGGDGEKEGETIEIIGANIRCDCLSITLGGRPRG